MEGRRTGSGIFIMRFTLCPSAATEAEDPYLILLWGG